MRFLRAKVALNNGRFLLLSNLKKQEGINWRPQRDSNPRRRRERPVSWTRLDDGDLCVVFEIERKW